MTLSKEEYDVLNKIAERTKADCWFLLLQDDCCEDYVYDLEECKNLSLADGVAMLMETIDCRENYENCRLDEIEEDILRALLKKLDIDFQKKSTH